MSIDLTPDKGVSIPKQAGPKGEPTEELDFRALFIGDQSENGEGVMQKPVTGSD